MPEGVSHVGESVAEAEQWGGRLVLVLLPVVQRELLQVRHLRPDPTDRPRPSDRQLACRVQHANMDVLRGQLILAFLSWSLGLLTGWVRCAR